MEKGIKYIKVDKTFSDFVNQPIKNENKNRLTTDNYKKPKMTITDKLTLQQVEEKLEDYVEIKAKDWINVKIGTHIRYFSIVDGKKKFRPGGFLKNKTNVPTYIILSNGTKTWSVQMEETTFYRKLSYDEIKKEFGDIIKEIEKEKEELIYQVEELEQKNKDLIEYIKAIKKQK